MIEMSLLQPGAVFEIYRFYSNADKYFKIICLNNLFAISVAVKYFTNFNKDIFIFLLNIKIQNMINLN